MFPQLLSFINVHPTLGPILLAAYSGFIGAFVLDMANLYRTSIGKKGWAALKEFDWNVASFRWFHGIMGSLLSLAPAALTGGVIASFIYLITH